MSSISSVSSTTSAYQTTNQSSSGQFGQDLSAVTSALQSGDLSTAQSAMATLQQNLQDSSQTSATQPFGKNTQANTDFQNLTSALKSGNLSAAQQASTSLTNDLKTSHKGHHHHGASATAATPATTAATSATTSTGGSSIVGEDGSLNVTA